MNTAAIVIDLGYTVVFLLAAWVLYRLCRTPRRTRISVMPAELSPEDEALVAEAAARMKAYGETVADYYDTTPGDR